MSSLKNNYQLTSTSYLSPLVLLKTSTEAISSYFPSSQRQQLERRGREMDCTTAEEPDAVVSDTFNGCFDCNICLDIVVEPVVTVCGHLYCWSCIYKWLQQAEDTSSQQCPVCKAALSETTLVPLYGRGCSSKNCHQNLKIPRRPSVHREIVEYHMSEGGNGENTDAHQPIEYASSDSRLMNSMTSGVLEGMAIGVIRWLLGCQDSMDMHYMSPYYMSGDAGSSSIRMQEVEVVKSLHQIWLFLFVFAVLCLLLF